MNLPSLSILLEKVGLDSRVGKIPPHKIVGRTKRVREDYELYVKVVELKDQGLKPTAISRETGLPVPTIKSWLSGRRMPFSIASLLKEHNRRNAKFFTNPTKEDENFAYVLGFYLGNVGRKEGLKSSIHYSGEQEAVSNRLVDKFTKLLGEDCFKRRGRALELRSVSLLSNTYQICSRYTRIPWEHVNTDYEKLAFLRGYFDSRVHSRNFVIDNNIVISVCGESMPEILEQVVVLLSDFSLFPHYDDKSVYPFILFTDPSDARKLLEQEIIVGDTNNLWKKVSSAADSKSLLDTYYRSLTLREQGVNINEILSEVNSIPEGTVKAWLYDGRVPFIARRNEKIQKFRNKYKYRYAVTYLFREIGLRCKPEELDFLAKSYGSVEELSIKCRELEDDEVLKENYLRELKSRMPNRLHGGGILIF